MPQNIDDTSKKESGTIVRVLLAPLDWGLGHASRCVPLIQLLVQKGFDVLIASSGAQMKLLQAEFPSLTFVELPGYNVQYAKKRLMLQLAAQLLKINAAIKQEHSWLKSAISKYEIDWVISDNRYGLYCSSIPCTIITHQLSVQLPALLQWAEGLLKWRLYKFISAFNECWIPDSSVNEFSLSGALGHAELLPAVPVRYIGWLTRLKAGKAVANPVNTCVIVLSGPEPQRTLLEGIVLKQISGIKKPVILVRGLPNENTSLNLPKNITVHNHLPAAGMQEAFNNSEFLISRTGYSTLMDAFSLQKKCILIPTPGQTEQEYLGKRLTSKKMALVYPQDQFNLEEALSKAADFEFNLPAFNESHLLESAVADFIKKYFAQPVEA